MSCHSLFELTAHEVQGLSEGTVDLLRALPYSFYRFLHSCPVIFASCFRGGSKSGYLVAQLIDRLGQRAESLPDGLELGGQPAELLPDFRDGSINLRNRAHPLNDVLQRLVK